MCAIAGMIGIPYDEAVVKNMLDTMRRRGPDGNGIFSNGPCCLLHSRLAIIDPDGGRQPMEFVAAGEHYCIAYNGELYNTEEIRHELKKLGHDFTGHSDTEVVLHAYAQWKDECLHHFNGIYAFAVWESKRRRLFLARDPMGVKPIFYKLHGTGMLFASEMKTILQHPDVEAVIDSEGAAQILLLGPGRKPGSGVFKDILELEPGCCGYWEDGKWSWRRYWKLLDAEHTDSFEETAERVRFLVKDSIQRQMVSDVPIGTFLSGGLDSSLISAICAEAMADKGMTLPTFSVDYLNNDRYFVPGKFQPNSDNSYILTMQKVLHTKHHWTVLTPEELIGSLQEATDARDLPGMADVDFSLLAFCKQIRREVKVALSGECADEIFGGYPWYRDPAVRDRDGFPWAQNTTQRTAFLAEDITGKLNPEEFVRECYLHTLKETDILPGASELEIRMKQMVNLNYRWFMQTLLDRKDRMSMYCSLEVRVPFCDYRIAEYLYAVPWGFKDHNGYEKGLLRYAMRGILPEEVLWRKKSPYPKTHDPKYLELVSDILKELLQRNDAPIFGIVSKERLRGLLNASYSWPWYGQLMQVPQTIAFMLQINYWLEKYSVRIV